MERVVEAVEDPTTTAPSPLLYHLCSVAARESKVVISGEGADELFAGYPWVRAQFPYAARSLASWAAGPLLRGPAQRIMDPRWGRAFRIVSSPSARHADREWLRGLTPYQKRRLLHPDLPTGDEDPDVEPLRPPEETLESCQDRLQERLSVEMTRRLPDGLLLIHDKVSMAHSLEVRMPFLDRHVVDFALSLPSGLKIRHSREKYILRRLVERHLPGIAGRRKYGLHFPMLAPPTHRLSRFLRERLLDSAAGRELFNRTRLEPFVDQVLDGRRDGIRALWNLTNLAMWWDRFISR